jgi:tyrosine-protein kinase Etk/Wzc
MAQQTKEEAFRTTEEPQPLDIGRDVETARFPEPLIVLAKHKAFILKFVGLAIVLALVTVLLLQKSYTANAKILPPQQNQSISTSAMISQLGPLAGLAGKLDLKSPSDLYIAMLRSRTVADNLITRFDLMNVYKQKLHEYARTQLEESTEIKAGKEGVISISVRDTDPKRAADLANSYIEELEILTRTLAVTEAAQRRLFFEREVKTASDDLASAELALKKTQEQTGLILLDSQSRAMIESLSSMRAHVAAQEVLVQSMRSFATSENPDLVRAEQELSALRGQLARLEGGGGGKRSFTEVPIENVPTAGLEYVRKLREVRYREALFELLAKQYEAAKIDEARDALIVQRLDKAIKPERKSWPPKAALLLASMLLALLIAVCIVFLREWLKKAKEGPQFAAQFQLFKYYLRGERKP